MGIASSVAMNMSGHHVSNTTAAGLIPYDDHHHRRRSLLLGEPPQTFHHGAYPPPSSSQNHRLSVTSVLSHWSGDSETTLALEQRLDDSFSRPTFGQVTTSLVSRDGAERDDDQVLYSATITTTVSEPAREIPVCLEAMMDDKQRECIETSLAVYPPSLLSERNLSTATTPPSSSLGCTHGRTSWWSTPNNDTTTLTDISPLTTNPPWTAMSTRRTSVAVGSAVMRLFVDASSS